jgi:hypothetical protein
MFPPEYSPVPVFFVFSGVTFMELLFDWSFFRSRLSDASPFCFLAAFFAMSLDHPLLPVFMTVLFSISIRFNVLIPTVRQLFLELE